MEKYTLQDMARGKFVFFNENDIVKLDEVRTVKTKITNRKKTIYIHIGLINYFFNSDLKKTILERIKNDIGVINHIYKFRI